MASYFTEAGNLNGEEEAREICLSFQIDHRSRTFTISPTTMVLLATILDFSMTTTTILPFRRVTFFAAVNHHLS